MNRPGSSGSSAPRSRRAPGADEEGALVVRRPIAERLAGETLRHRQVTQSPRIPERFHDKAVLRCGWAFYPVQVAILATVYFGAAKLGLTMAFVAEQVTAVWPPTGIALAALLLFGYRGWAGIALGAFLANATVSEPLGIAAGISFRRPLGR